MPRHRKKKHSKSSKKRSKSIKKRKSVLKTNQHYRGFKLVSDKRNMHIRYRTHGKAGSVGIIIGTIFIMYLLFAFNVFVLTTPTGLAGLGEPGCLSHCMEDQVACDTFSDCSSCEERIPPDPTSCTACGIDGEGNGVNCDSWEDDEESAGFCPTDCVEICNNDLDDDLDSFADCVDVDCVGQSCGSGCTCENYMKTETNCDDSQDNDNDGQTDCDDGDCSGGPVCSCSPDCSGKDCGDDGCGGSCGTCGTGYTCQGNTCIEDCVPDCSGKECGSDGCSGLCGQVTVACTATFGTCELQGTKTCLGTSYGDCSPADPRIATCEGKECGSDGCGGFCDPYGETCPAGLDCQANICVPIGCYDNDEDGFSSVECGGVDCNDNDADINPEALEICDDLKDNDCDGIENNGCCGNSEINANEVCDGTNLASQTCPLQGFTGGTLTCKSDCSDFDVSECINCGNGIIDSALGEDCDHDISGGFVLGGATCESEGWELGGELACDGFCKFDTTSCETDEPCGNNIARGPEKCDGTDLKDETCEGLGFGPGTLTCDSDCTFLTVGCSEAEEEEDEEEDSGTVEILCSDTVDNDSDGLIDCDDSDCATSPDCMFCGNGLLSGTEQCDGAFLNDQTCQSLGFDLGGSLSCSEDCKFDTSSCEISGEITKEQANEAIQNASRAIDQAETESRDIVEAKKLLNEAISAFNDDPPDYVLTKNRANSAIQAIGDIILETDNSNLLMIGAVVLVLIIILVAVVLVKGKDYKEKKKEMLPPPEEPEEEYEDETTEDSYEGPVE